MHSIEFPSDKSGDNAKQGADGSLPPIQTLAQEAALSDAIGLVDAPLLR